MCVCKEVAYRYTPTASTALPKGLPHYPTCAVAGLPEGLPHLGSHPPRPPSKPHSTGLPNRLPTWVATGNPLPPIGQPIENTPKATNPHKFFWIRSPPCPRAHAVLYPQKVRRKQPELCGYTAQWAWGEPCERDKNLWVGGRWCW